MEAQPAGSVDVVRKKKPILVFLILSVLIVLFVIGGLFLYRNFKKKNQTNSVKPTMGESSYSRQIKAQANALKKDKTYANYRALFDISFNDYLETGKNEDRLVMEQVAKDAKGDFPGDFKDADFVIPCFDAGCKVLAPDGQIKEIIDTVSSVGNVQTFSKRVALNRLYLLKYFDNAQQDQKLSLHNAAFKNLAEFYKSVNKDPGLVPALEKMAGIIRQKFPEGYSNFNKVNYYAF